MLSRLLLIVAFTFALASTALAGPLPQPAHVVTTNAWDMIVHGGKVVLGIAAILIPSLVAFYRKDRDALNRLLLALPEIYNVVEQERRKGALKATKVDRGLELAAKIKGSSLSEKERARLGVGLKAIHEEVRNDTGPEVVHVLKTGPYLPPGAVIKR